MHECLRLAEASFEEGETPVGALVTFEDRVVGRGRNQIERLNDPTAHAEMIAVTAAAATLERPRLEGCRLYVTLEPCAMCAGAALLARVDEIYFGAFDPKFGAVGSLYNIVEEGKYNHRPRVYSGLLEDESRRLLRDFFSKIRDEKRLR
ncbi:MAG: tRNA-specific adenosine deaminase [Ignavibacteriales bacterium]|nr:tRNA-specific adenosine deaminase [Ignavibacteriales bacterium]